MVDSTPESWQRAGTLFDELIELEAAEREDRLHAVAAEDPDLAGEVRELVAACRAADDFLEHAALDLVPTWVQGALEDLAGPPALAVGTQLAAWRLVRRLGAGGMGEVWEVERADGAFEQRAALKLLKRGLDSEEILRRFRAERQILARLRHRGIAHLYDGGLAPDGRPFFVMELVAGEPITVACARRELSVEERVRLVLAVCEAVEVAHRSLVVHRDLKPPNILVTPAGEVKLLDFGIAKLLGDDGVEPAQTRAGERVLTPAYAAPEQILGEPVTTAADVYSLGVVLYELLTERLPHRRAPGTTAGLADAVTRETVERPSSAVRREPVPDGDGREPLTEAERAGRSRRLRGDLDSIVLRALAREPERRYPSAAALAADLRRHLEGHPVEARPDSLGYRTVKALRRHRVAVAFSGLVLLSLVAGLGAALWQAREARAQAARAERVKELLADVFLGAGPERARGGEITARELLADGAQRVEEELGDEPEVQAELLTTIASVEESLGLLESARVRAERAVEITERAYGPNHPRMMASLSVFGGVLSQLERDAESLVVRQRALDIARASFPADSLEVARGETEVINAYFGLDRFAEALSLGEHALRVVSKELGEDHLDTIRLKLNLAFALEFLDRMDEAIALGRGVLASYERALGPDDPRTLEALHSLAVSLAWVGQNEEAVALFGRAIEGSRRVLGPDHYRLAFSLQQSTLPLRELERYEDADDAAREAMAIFLALAVDHPEATGALNGLATSDMARHDFAAAEDKYRRAMSEWTATRGPEHRSTLQARANLARALASRGRWEDAEPLAREALAARERIFGADSAFAAHSRWVLGEVLRAAGRPAEALAEHERARTIAAEVFGEAHNLTVRAGIAIALDYLDQVEAGGGGSLAAVAEALARAEAGQRALDPEHSRLAEIDLVRARLALADGRTEDAVALAAAARRRYVARLGEAAPGAAEAARWQEVAQQAAAVGSRNLRPPHP
jgi:eukaryotic-like serine/threonine-protein kinase